jgi:hypothetical protein
MERNESNESNEITGPYSESLYFSAAQAIQ